MMHYFNFNQQVDDILILYNGCQCSNMSAAADTYTIDQISKDELANINTFFSEMCNKTIKKKQATH